MVMQCYDDINILSHTHMHAHAHTLTLLAIFQEKHEQITQKDQEIARKDQEIDTKHQEIAQYKSRNQQMAVRIVTATLNYSLHNSVNRNKL